MPKPLTKPAEMYVHACKKVKVVAGVDHDARHAVPN